MRGVGAVSSPASRIIVIVDGEAYLRREIENGLRRIGEEGAHAAAEHSVSRLMAEVQGAASALVAAGALERERMHRVMEQFATLLTERGLLKKVEISLDDEPEPGAATRRPPPPQKWRTALEEPGPPEIRQVLPVAEEAGTVEGRRIVVVSVDVWSDHLDIRSGIEVPHFLTSPSVGTKPLWEVWDDAGTTYLSEGWGGSGRKQWVIRQDTFRPAPPPEASELTLSLKSEEGAEVTRISVRLPKRRRRAVSR